MKSASPGLGHSGPGGEAQRHLGRAARRSNHPSQRKMVAHSDSTSRFVRSPRIDREGENHDHPHRHSPRRCLALRRPIKHGHGLGVVRRAGRNRLRPPSQAPSFPHRHEFCDPPRQRPLGLSKATERLSRKEESSRLRMARTPQISQTAILLRATGRLASSQPESRGRRMGA